MSAIICLTYDDALPVHREAVAPALSALGLRGTFFATASSGDLHAHAEGWRRVAAAGHELGNHSCWHPCRGRPAWLPRAYHLEDYDRRRIRDELMMADRVLRLIDGRERRTFAATCGNTTYGPGNGDSFLDDIADLCTAVRSGHTEEPLTGPAPFVVPALPADRRRADAVIAAAERMRGRPDAWLPVLLHGVGEGTHNLFMAADEHRRLLEWIAAQRGWLQALPLAEAVAQRGRR